MNSPATQRYLGASAASGVAAETRIEHVPQRSDRKVRPFGMRTRYLRAIMVDSTEGSWPE